MLTERQQTPDVAVGQRAFTGLVWMASQTVLVKLVTAFCQVALAWLLVPEDFGVAGLAMTVAAFVNAVEGLGLRHVLLRRQKRFDRWSGTAFLISLGIGCLGTVAILVAAPAAAWLYDSPRLIPVLAVLAPVALIRNLEVVPLAKLEQRLSFRVLALTTGSGAVVVATLSVGLAALGFGAYSLILPFYVSGLLRLTIFWRFARPALRCVRISRWRYLLGNSGTITGSSLLINFMNQADYMILGIFVSDALVGLYFFAFRLSAQVFSLLGGAMDRVMLPSLARMTGSPAGQADAAIRASRMLAIVSLPLCCLQSVLADPLLKLLFQPEWWGAIRPLQMLSIALGLRIVAQPTGPLLHAQGRYGTDLRLKVVAAISFATLVALGAWSDGIDGAALGVLIQWAVVGPLGLILAARRAPDAARRTCGAFLLPLAACGLAWVAAAAVTLTVPGIDDHWWLEIPAVGAIFLIVYSGISFCLAPEVWRDLARRLGQAPLVSRVCRSSLRSFPYLGRAVSDPPANGG